MACPVDDVNAYRVTWTKENSLLAEIPQVGTPLIPPALSGRVSVNGSDVIIQGVELLDEGSYTCAVLDTSFTTEVSTVGLLVRVQPQTPVITLSGSPAAGQLQPGTNVTLVCHSWSGRPAAQLTWYRDGHLVNGTYLAVHDPDGFGSATVTVPLTVTEADDGVVYECVASGPAPIVTQTATVTLDVATVQTPAVIKTTVPSHVDSPGITTDLPAGGVAALAGSRALLSCDVGNVPVAKITWENDRGLVAEQTTGSVALIPPVLRDRVQVNGSDVIMDPVLVSDEGQYSCTVLHRDTFQELTDTVDLLVRVQPQAPVITIPGSPAAGQLQPGTNVTLVCHSWSGRPAAQLTWYRDGHSVNGVYTSSADVDGYANATLAVTLTVTAADDGVTYECVTSGPPPVVTERVEVTLRVLLPTTTTVVTTTETTTRETTSTEDTATTRRTTTQNSDSHATVPSATGTVQTTGKGDQTDESHTTRTPPGGGVVEAQSGTPLLTEPQIILVVIGTAMLLVILVASVVAVQKGCFRSKWEANLTTGSISQSVGSSYRANILYANAGNGYDGPASEMEMKNKELIKPPPEKII
ncbi:PREDICTED: kin of IRRE-like protein 1 [Branchiostoma belcheri]|uniref:Kin of IRRE-like protein 1 n=1 Tax=Branchiostoma belcheri TaxID=7741 RepID=A0A6P4YU85_BRABE|nr:PREDICTED: kin of IRRE-like protein 1 [Branchiostoma belcheri]